ncbi:MAG: ATP-binding cassette domain-containing protein [Anaerolineaceae bacterium]|nr:ATP-binding cassette domain-containing protein [Anaerolineaceae bacterium]
MTPKLQLRDIMMTFRTRRGDEVIAVDNLSLDVNNGEFLSIVGPSGCGKSTLLRVVAGLIEPTSGEVLLDGRLITRPGADRGMVFQSYTLFPWLTVKGNVEFGPRLKGLPKSECSQLAQKYLEMVGLKGFENSYPKELSGGMMQRVAIARALANDPEVLLMDEPFGALDAQTRSIMQELLVNLWQQTPKTIIFVTHDIDEALFISDRVYIMTARPGRIKQVLNVELPRPRTFEMITTPEFIEQKKLVLDAIKEESLKAISLVSETE